MAKSKVELMGELKSLQSKKSEIEAKQKAGDTTEATRLELAEVNEQISAKSDEIKGTITTVHDASEVKTETKVEEAKPKVEETVKTKATEEVKPKYVVKDSEKHLFHVELTKGKRFDSDSGKEISSPFMQILTDREYDSLKANAAVLGYTMKVIHNPKK